MQEAGQSSFLLGKGCQENLLTFKLLLHETAYCLYYCREFAGVNVAADSKNDS